jgi:DNA modification methylase
MRKPGENQKPVTQTIPVEVWQRYASPVWAVLSGTDSEGFGICEQDINPSDTLQYESARDHEDERHICPLQVEVARRGITLWSAPDDVVLSPFAGIGTEVHEAVRLGRQGLGVELKPSYFKQACANLSNLEAQSGLFDTE